MNGSKKVVDSPCMSLELCNDGGGVTRWSIGDSDATAQLKMAEPARLSHFEPGSAIKLAHDQNKLDLAHKLAQPG